VDAGGMVVGHSGTFVRFASATTVVLWQITRAGDASTVPHRGSTGGLDKGPFTNSPPVIV
jgi:hypothetical protein